MSHSVRTPASIWVLPGEHAVTALLGTVITIIVTLYGHILDQAPFLSDVLSFPNPKSTPTQNHALPVLSALTGALSQLLVGGGSLLG